jgi:hypothetical protein
VLFTLEEIDLTTFFSKWLEVMDLNLETDELLDGGNAEDWQ